MTGEALQIGLFVGGKGSRMGGVKKGLLAATDTGEPLAQRSSRLCRAVLPHASITLVGDSLGYEELGLPSLPDDPPGIGPLGGLRALLLRAELEGTGSIIALACDLPHLSPALLQRLASHGSATAAVVPRLEGIWQPLFARYPVALTLEAVEATLAAHQRALQRVVERIAHHVVELPLSAQEAELLRDWDTPEDVRGGPA